MSSADPRAGLHRSYLYVPGSDEDRVRKALTLGADAVIVDLEDAVSSAAKPTARSTVAAVIGQAATAAACDVHVRIDRNDDGGYRQDDLEAAVGPGLAGLRLPKVEDPQALGDLDARLSRLEQERGIPAGTVLLYPTFESALGMVRISEILTASERVARAAIGTSDLLADLMAAGDDDLATLHVRSELVLRSRACRVGPPIDSVHVDLDDEQGLIAGAQRARALGFVGKSVIHPRQLAPVHEVFTPTDEQLERAERIVTAAEVAAGSGTGGFELDGEFVDAAVVARARGLLRLRQET